MSALTAFHVIPVIVTYVDYNTYVSPNNLLLNYLLALKASLRFLGFFFYYTTIFNLQRGTNYLSWQIYNLKKSDAFQLNNHITPSYWHFSINHIFTVQPQDFYLFLFILMATIYASILGCQLWDSFRLIYQKAYSVEYLRCFPMPLAVNFDYRICLQNPMCFPAAPC